MPGTARVRAEHDPGGHAATRQRFLREVTKYVSPASRVARRLNEAHSLWLQRSLACTQTTALRLAVCHGVTHA